MACNHGRNNSFAWSAATGDPHRTGRRRIRPPSLDYAFITG
jgi:hypothetical protein